MSRGFALVLVVVFLMSSCIVVAKPVYATSEIENTWTEKTPFPQEVGVVRAAVVNGKIYVMGGSTNYEYDPVMDSWVTKTPMLTPRWHFGIAVYQNKIYTLGDWNGSVANEVYDPSTDSWTTKTPMPTNRSESMITACAIGGKIHSFGLGSHDIYDVETNSWTVGKVMPFSFYDNPSTVLNHKIYVVGWNKTQIYDPESDSWSFGASPPTSVSSPAICAAAGILSPKRIYVFGGSPSFLQYTNITQVYDPENNTWTFGATMPTARGEPTAAVVNDQIYVIGGGFLWGETETTNELYIPLGYGTPDPSYDATAPIITITSPEKKTYYTTDIPLNFSVNEQGFWTRYQLDNQTTTEIPDNTTLTGLSYGQHNLTVYANDNAGNTEASETINFTIAKPFPTVPVAAVSVAVLAVVAVAGLVVYFKKHKNA